MRVVALGDSITAGFGVATPWVTTLGTHLSSYFAPIVNAGVNGDTTAQMLTRWTSTYRATNPRWLVVLGGINDLATRTATQVEADLNSIYTQAAADGTQVIPVTILPRTGLSAPDQAKLEDVNTWIRSQPFNYVDAYDSALRTGTSLSAIYDSGDGLHPNQAGADYLESLIRSKFP